MPLGVMKPDGGSNYQPSRDRPNSTPPPAQMPTPTQPAYNYPSPNLYASNTGQYASRPVNVPASTPGPVPDIESFLGADSGYQSQLAQIAKALTDLQADITRRTGTVETQYGDSNRALEDQKIRDLKSLEEDFAARGLIKSGLYGTAVGDYQTEFGQRVSELARNRADALALLTQEQGQFTSQQELAKQQAREQALQKRSSQYGV